MNGPAPRDLDHLLATWARANRLPDGEAERVRLAILPAAPGLPSTWWTEFNGRISAAITRANSTPVPGLEALPGL